MRLDTLHDATGLDAGKANGHRAVPPRDAYSAWAHRRDVTFTVSLWVLLGVAAIWALSYVIGPLLIVVLAALLAYALTPIAQAVARVLPLPLAIVIVYLALIGVLGGVGYLFVSNAIGELSALATQISHLLTPPTQGAETPLAQQLAQLGLSQTQIQDLTQRVVEQFQNAAQNALPLLGNVANGLVSTLLDIVLILVLSIYFLVAGPRLVRWLRSNAPVRQRGRLALILDSLRHVIGGYLRGQLILSTTVGTLVGGGMYLLHVPYAALLGLLAFLLEFIPTLGTLLSGAICVLVALTQGWQLALIVLGYFVVIHLLEGYVVAPRVLAKAIGIHPAISIIALLVGAQILGIWGALFAAPAVGLLQVLVTALWAGWQQAHPQQVAEAEDDGGVPLVVPVVTADTLTATP
jgi:predicted PurR-regulated permease PerM